MTGAFAFLIVHSARNAALTKLRRLRQPRYAIVTVVGLLYFAQMYFQSGQGLAMFGLSRQVVLSLGPVLLLLLFTRPWWWPKGGRGGLGFSPADVQLLFPAPVTRRQLVVYHFVRAQTALLMGAAFFTVFSQPASMATALQRLVGIWVLTGVMALHSMVVTLSRTGAVKGEWPSMARRWLPALVTAAMLTVVLWTLVLEWPTIAAASGAAARIARAGVVLSSGASGLALWPFRMLVQLPAAAGAGQFAAALPAVALIWGLMMVWVLHTDAEFEEQSAEQAEKMARFLRQKTVTAAPTKARGSLFALRPAGRAEIAFLWKNLIAAGHVSKLYLIFMFGWAIPLGIVFIAVEGMDDLGGLLAILCLGIAWMIVIVGATQVTFDLRQDLSQLSIIKTWPVSGATVVRGEVLAPAIVLSSLMAVLVVLGAALGGRTAATELGMPVSQLWQWTIAVVCLCAGIILLQVVFQNLVAVMFPAWIRIGPKAAVGIEGMGQQMVVMFGSLLVVPILAVPALLLGGAVWFGLQWTVGFVPVVVPAIVTTAGLVVEGFLGAELAGRVLDRTDISAVT